MRQSRIDPADARSLLAYDGQAGTIVRLRNGKSAVSVRPNHNRHIAYVSLHSHNEMATHVIYALVYGLAPNGVRTRFVDGNPANLRRDNLVFSSDSAEAPVGLRTHPAILAAMAALGKPATRGEIRQQAGLTACIGPYLRLMEADGKVHVTGVGKGAGRGNGRNALLWALGPGDGTRPAETLALSQQRRNARLSYAPPIDVEPDEDIEAELNAAAQQDALVAVNRARCGAIANSVFALGNQGGRA